MMWKMLDHEMLMQCAFLAPHQKLTEEFTFLIFKIEFPTKITFLDVRRPLCSQTAHTLIKHHCMGHAFP